MKTCATIGVLFLMAGHAAGQCSLQQARPDGLKNDDQAGSAAAVAGNVLLVGAPNDDAKGADAGAVYAMARQAGIWAQQAKLNTKNAKAGDRFGASVAFDGALALVGAPGASPSAKAGAGSVTAYSLSGGVWKEGLQLLIQDYAAGDAAGTSVAMSGPWAIIGAPKDDTVKGADAGTISFVSIGQDGTLTVQDKKTAPDGVAQANFGQVVAIDGPWAMVSAPGVKVGGQDGAGEVHAYHLVNGSWQWAQTILAGDGGPGDAFGTGLAVSGEVLVVGAPGHATDGYAGSGAGYIFRYNGTKWVKELETSWRHVSNDHFGDRAAISGDRAYFAVSGKGRVFPFRYSNGSWGGYGEILDPDGPSEGAFGSVLATDGVTLVIGDRLDDDAAHNLTDAGAVYTMTLNPPCIADFNSDGVVDIFDFLAFQNAFVAQLGTADMDCNGIFDFFDFLGYQNKFVAGCH